MEAVVIGAHEEKVIIPDHNVMMIPFRNESEAHFVCAVLNSDIATKFVTSYVEWFYSTHILDYFKMPTFDTKLSLHRRLAAHSVAAHAAAANGEEAKVNEVEANINSAVRKLSGFEHL